MVDTNTSLQLKYVFDDLPRSIPMCVVHDLSFILFQSDKTPRGIDYGPPTPCQYINEIPSHKFYQHSGLAYRYDRLVVDASALREKPRSTTNPEAHDTNGAPRT